MVGIIKERLEDTTDDQRRAILRLTVITVILIGVIVSVSLGGDQVSKTAPLAHFEVESSGDVTSITHKGGDSIAAENIALSVDGVTFDCPQGWAEGNVTPGDTCRFKTSDLNGDEVTVIWTGADEPDSIGTYSFR